TGTGGAGRKGNITQIGHQSGNIKTFAADVEVAPPALAGAAVEGESRQRIARRFPQRFDMGGVVIAALHRELRRRAEPGTERGAERARAQAALLPAAVDLRSQIDPIAHPQGADALGAMEL